MSTDNIDTQDLSQEDLQKAADFEALYEAEKEYDALEAERAPAAQVPPHATLLRGMGLDPKKVKDYQNADDIEEEKNSVFYSVPPLPLDCLSPKVREIIEGVSRAKHVDTWIPFAVLLKAVCACVGSSVLLEQDDNYNPCHLWLVLAAQSGIKKSEVNRAIFAPIQRVQREQFEKYKEEIEQYHKDKLKYDATVEASLKDKNIVVPEEPKKPINTHYYVGDITEESLFGVLKHNPQGLLWNSDEFLDWLKGLGKYKTGDTGLKNKLLGCYTGEEFLYTRVKNGNNSESVDHAWLSIFGNTQPDSFAEAITPADFKTGFLQRFTWIFAKKLPALKPEEPRYRYDPTPAAEIFEKMLSWPRLMPGEEKEATLAYLQSSSDILLKKLFYKYEHMYENFGTDFEQTRSLRWAAQLSRLVLCLHCLDRAISKAPDGGGVINESTVENGIKIFEALIEHSIEAERRIRKESKEKKEPDTINTLDFFSHIRDLLVEQAHIHHLDYNEKIDGVSKIDLLKQRLAGGEMAVTSQRVTKHLECYGFVKTRISSGTRMSLGLEKYKKLVAASDTWEQDKKNREARRAAGIVPM